MLCDAHQDFVEQFINDENYQGSTFKALLNRCHAHHAPECKQACAICTLGTDRYINNHKKIDDKIDDVHFQLHSNTYFIDTNQRPIIQFFGKTADNQTVLCNIEEIEPYFIVECNERFCERNEVQRVIDIINKEFDKQRNKNKYINQKYGSKRDERECRINRFEFFESKRFFKYDFDKKREYVKMYTNIPQAVSKIARSMRQGITMNYKTKQQFLTYESNVPFTSRFRINRDIKGHSWVTIRNPTPKRKRHSTCDLEFDCVHHDLYLEDEARISGHRVESIDIEAAGEDDHFPDQEKDACIMISSYCKDDHGKGRMFTHMMRGCLESKDSHVATFSGLPDVLLQEIVNRMIESFYDTSRNMELVRFADFCARVLPNDLGSYIIHDVMQMIQSCIDSNKNQPIIPAWVYEMNSPTLSSFLEWQYQFLAVFPDVNRARTFLNQWIFNRNEYHMERMMLESWAELTVNFDPDIITGYNINGFDFPYLIGRAKQVNAKKFFHISRLRDKKLYIQCNNFNRNGPQTNGTITDDSDMNTIKKYTTVIKPSQKRDDNYEKKKPEEKNNGFNNNKTIIIGRIVVDMLDVARGSLNLGSYTLNSVANDQLNDQKDDLHYSYITPYYNASDIERDILRKYCEKDAELPLRLLEKMKEISQSIELAKMTGIMFGEVRGRGQQHRCYSKLLEVVRKLGYTIIHEDNEQDMRKYDGAYVLDPVVGWYQQELVHCLDFKSLYPTCIIAHNICYTTLIEKDLIWFDEHEGLTIEQQKQMCPKNKVPSYIYNVVSVQPRDENLPPKIFYVVKKEIKKGILPMILEEWLDQRVFVKRQMFLAWKTGKTIRAAIKQFKMKDTIDPTMVLKEIRSMWNSFPDEVKKDILSDLPQAIKEYIVWSGDDDPDVPMAAVSDVAPLLEKVIMQTFTGNLAVMIKTEKTIFKGLSDLVVSKVNEDQKIPDIVRKFMNDSSAVQTIDQLRALIDKWSKELHNVDFEHDQLNARQIAIKLCCNAVYGFTAANKLQLKDLAEMITGMGRAAIVQTQKLLNDEWDRMIEAGEIEPISDEERKRMIVYGDTDSVMIRIPYCKDFKSSIAEAKRLADLNTKWFIDNNLSPIELEWELATGDTLFMGKKCYAGILYNEKGPLFYDNGKPQLKKKGIRSVRRDCCRLAARMMNNMLEKLLLDRDVESCKQEARDTIEKLLLNQVSVIDLKMSATYKKHWSEYKVPQKHASLVRRMEERGDENTPQVRDRVEFVIVRGTSSGKYKQKTTDRSECPVHKVVHNIPLDFDWYIDKQLRNCIERVLRDPKVVPQEEIEKTIFHGKHTVKRVIETPIPPKPKKRKRDDIDGDRHIKRRRTGEPQKEDINRKRKRDGTTGAAPKKQKIGLFQWITVKNKCLNCRTVMHSDKACCSKCIHHTKNVHEKLITDKNDLLKQQKENEDSIKKFQGEMYGKIRFSNKDTKEFYNRPIIKNKLNAVNKKLSRAFKP